MNPRRARVLLAALLALLAAAVLLRFPPDRYSFYPRCPIAQRLHLQCPGCGATRALASLLRGNLAEALHQNLLVVALLPFLLGYAALCFIRAWRQGEFLWPQPPRWTIPATFVLAAAFTVIRNLAL